MQQKLEATLAKLVLIPSVTGDLDACQEVVHFAKSELENMGLFVYHSTDGDNPWLVATSQNTKTPDILLMAHLDVVPAPSELFSMKERDGKLYGRGVYDMKLAAACYIELLKAHRAELSDVNIGVLFSTDEESDGKSIADVIAWGLRPKVILLPDGGDNWKIEKRAKGVYNVELVAKGKTSHGSRPWEGENALHTLLEVARLLRSKYPANTPSETTLSITRLRGGETANQIPHSASMMIDFRSFSQQDLDDYKLLLAELVTNYGLELHTIGIGPPLLFDADNPNIQSFLEAFQKPPVQKEIHYCESYGASDARFFAQYDVPCIIVEPNGGGRHSNDEWLETTDLLKFYQLIERWVFHETAIS